MPRIFEETFSDLGEDLHAHVDLLKCDPNYRLHFHDGQIIRLTTDLPDLLSEIQRFEGNSPATDSKFLAFLAETGIHYE
jgi:phytoene desaturase (3,4-didehydrolycopene-forming)